jgi:sec-independent protein translocase protein TatA
MDSLFLMFGLGGYEVIVVLFVVILLFGGRKIPELMRGLGKGIREFNNARATIEGEIKEGMKEADRKKLEEEKKAKEENNN